VIKRFFDFIISLIAIVLCAPVMMIIACLIQFRMGEPIFFIQSRLGMDGAPFSMIKFRTMRNDIDVQGALLSDNKRITKLGAFLRSSSLDELPELFNVLKGDMSLVGPRPLLIEYLSLYNDNQKKRQNVLPGITGWAQVNGRNAISWEEKFNLDVWYVENQSFWLDMKILWITIKKVIMREGISADGEATMPKFTGNKK